MQTSTQDPDALGANVLSVALIGPQEQRRKSVAKALAGPQANVAREYSTYPQLDDVPALLEGAYDVIIVELDSNPEHALDLVEHICSNSSITVMVYSARADSELLVRCMRAGAREFLTHPIEPNTIAEAIVRTSVRRPAPPPAKKVTGKLLVFTGAKGGSGVTTVASNFAVCLSQELSKKAVLLDLDLPMGDAALDLGLTAQYTTANALQSFSRLDSTLFSKLLVKHASGLSVLAAPDRYTAIDVSEKAVEKLMTVAREEFDYVVVDAGSRLGPIARALIEDAATVYLVAQVSISELRNSNRLITECFPPGSNKLEVVLNRFMPRLAGIDEENITKALTVPARWKIPSDYHAVRLAQNTAVSLISKDSPISRVIRQMARTACGLPAVSEKKKFGLFR